MPIELQHLSYSSVSMYSLCARSWKYKYADRLPSPTTAPLAFGSAFHATVETVIRNNAERRGSDVGTIWRESWATSMQTVERWDDAPEALEADGLRMLGVPSVIDTLSQIRPYIDPQEGPLIEKRIELRVPGVAIPIIGYIDCIGEDGTPYDFKTASRMWTQEQAEKEIQPLFYLAALNQIGFKGNPQRKFKHVVFSKTKQPKVQVFEHTHTPAELMWLFGAVAEAWKGIQAGVFVPNPNAWKCSERYCDYWSSCRGKR